MGRTGKRKWAWLAGIGFVVGALAIVLWQVWPRERLLMDLARPILPLQEQEIWSWLAADQLLLITTDREGHYDGQPSWQGHAELFNRITQQRSSLPGLTTLLNRPDVSSASSPWGFELSPDHTWLLWINCRTGDGWPFPSAAHLDGTHYREWERDKREERFFLDNRHFVQEIGDEDFSVIIRDLQDPKKDRQYPATAPEAKAALAFHAAQHPFWIDVETPDQEHEKTFIEIDTYRTEDAIPVMFSYRYKDRAPAPIRKNLVRLPAGTLSDARDVRISPEQQLLCYHLQIAATNPLLDWLQHHFPKWAAKPHITEGLWISRSDGQGLYEIGHVPVNLNESGTPDVQLHSITWLPDSKQISFVYRNMLYVVPAERKASR